MKFRSDADIILFCKEVAGIARFQPLFYFQAFIFFSSSFSMILELQNCRIVNLTDDFKAKA